MSIRRNAAVNVPGHTCPMLVPIRFAAFVPARIYRLCPGVERQETPPRVQSAKWTTAVVCRDAASAASASSVRSFVGVPRAARIISRAVSSAAASALRRSRRQILSYRRRRRRHVYLRRHLVRRRFPSRAPRSSPVVAVFRRFVHGGPHRNGRNSYES